MTQAEVCRYLDWDSDFFGRRIARVEGHRLTAAGVVQIAAWCAQREIDCLYFLADSDDLAMVRLAEANDFRLQDVRLTLQTDLAGGLPAPEAEPGPRPWQARDLPALKAMARVNHRDSRFYQDPNFPSAACAALYETWIENSCRGYAEAVLVIEHAGQPGGYVSCHLRQPGLGQIGLLGVAEAAQGLGLGRRLLNGALSWFATQGAAQVSVVTQGRNVRAQRLYQRAGFLTESVRFWYHRWFDPVARRGAL